MLLQDNKSAVLLQKNCPFSAGKGSKHINVRHCCVVNKMEKTEVKIACWPTEEMVADYSSKPTQGGLFVKQRNKIQGIEPNDFEMHESWYERVLRKYDLWDDEEADLATVWRNQDDIFEAAVLNDVNIGHWFIFGKTIQITGVCWNLLEYNNILLS